MAIKVIIFDLGNVIVFVDHRNICEGISQWGVSAQDIHRYIFIEGIEAEFDKGQISPFDFYERIKKRFDLDLEFGDFIKVWSSGFSLNEDIFPLIKDLKSYYRLCLLSNTNQIHFEHVKNCLPILTEFEAFFLSFRLGVRKPDPSIFQMSIDFMKVMPQECVYIDDVEDFVESAGQLGINGITFKDVPTLKKSLHALEVHFQTSL